ncbi:MAG: GTP-binding protein, partial [Planctomycetota bacterium]
MKEHDPSEIRNVCIVGHSDSGKTSIADGLLFKAGAVKRLGSVKDGTSVFDFDDQEKAKKHTIELSQAHLEWKGVRVNLLDTPGYPDFLGDAVAAIAASDGVVICVNATQGVKVNTRRVFEVAESLGKARIIALTKCDQPDLDFERCVQEIQSWFGEKCIPVAIPQGFGPDFTATEKLLREKGGATEQGQAYYKAFVENAVLVDDEVTMRYLDGEETEGEELRRCFMRAASEGLLSPIISTSAEKDIGLRDLLDCFPVFVRSPDRAALRRRLFADGDDEGAPIEDPINGPFYGQVFKAHIDKHVGKIVYVKVLSGSIQSGQIIHNSSGAKKEKVGHMAEPFGKDLEPVESARVGDTIALTKMESIHLGDTITTEDPPRHLATIPFPRPMAHVAVRPANRGEEQKIAEALTKLSDEISTFHVERDPITHEAIASGISVMQLDLVFQRLKERYGIEVETSPARIPYRETATTPAEGHYRHKKQSGGRGQFGEVF